MGHLSEEALLLSIHFQDRLTPRQRHHLSVCPTCQIGQASITPLVGELNPTEALLPWRRVNPTIPSKKRHLLWIGAIVLATVTFMVWPRFVWKNAPVGPLALQTFVTGPSARLHQTSAAFVGDVHIRANRRTGWMLISYSKVTPPPKGYVYEVWWIAQGQHIRAGTFFGQSLHQSLWVHTSERVSDATAVGITIEPAPGTKTPTGLRTFVGRLR